MNKKFIYVFSEEDRDRLLRAGLQLIREDQKNRVYQFLIDGSATFSLENTQYMLTNRLDF